MNSPVTICSTVLEVKHMLKLLSMKNSHNKDLCKDVSAIDSKVSYIQRRAQKMEKRLLKYRRSIESLGFERIGGSFDD